MAQVGARSAALVAAVLLCWPPGAAPGEAPAARPSGIVVPAPTGRPARRHDESSVLVRFKTAATPANRATARARIGGQRLRSYSLVPGLELLRLGRGRSLAQALAVLRRLPFVAYAHRNSVIYIHQPPPDDELFAEQWALHNTGQGSGFGVWAPGVPDADVDWLEAWTEATGNGSVVAILDTGIDYRHADLAANVWLNAAEVAGTDGVDDDGNGYVDDVRGWDFVGDDDDPLDDHGHGSHVAGIVGAVANNQLGVAGVMWNGQVMALKILDDTGFGLLSDAIAALEYATTQGVRVVNASWGYSELTPEELPDHLALYDAVQAAAAANLLFVAAAGNDSADTDIVPHYPSAFDLDNIVAVAATDNRDELASFSNWGAASVDLAAPGQDVFSTYKRFAIFDDYAWLSGTSMAAPHVSGLAGLLAAVPACATYQQVRDEVLDHVRPIVGLTGLTATGGVLNVAAALNGTPCELTSLAVATTALPGTLRTMNYSVHLEATGGVPPYAWALANGALPAGIGLSGDGWLSGVVEAELGNYVFTIRVTDDAGATATQTLSIIVEPRRCSFCHQAGG